MTTRDAATALNSADNILCCLPLYHIYGLNVILNPALLLGARLVLVVGGGGAEVLVLTVGTVVVVLPEPPASARKLDALIVPRPVTRSYPGPAV